MMSQTITLSAGVGGFAEDKDEARRLRQDQILPALENNKKIVLDFVNVKYSTQSFVHALVGEVLARYGDLALKKLEFKNCAPQVKSLIQLVVDYSLGGFAQDSTINTSSVKRRTAKRRQANQK